jgi:DNA polymerase-3 subunit gamma/tau
MADSTQTELEPQAPYRVLARKYRPQTFEDLIGQDAMVQTLQATRSPQGASRKPIC